MAMKLATGSKLAKAPHDWGTAQGILEDFITKFTCDVFCTAVLVGHIEREVDEVTGGTTLMASAPGRKLAPKLSRWFDDVIHCRREGSKWDWSTNTTNMDLKSRHLGIRDKIEPSFTPLFKVFLDNRDTLFAGGDREAPLCPEGTNVLQVAAGQNVVALPDVQGNGGASASWARSACRWRRTAPASPCRTSAATWGPRRPTWLTTSGRRRTPGTSSTSPARDPLPH